MDIKAITVCVGYDDFLRLTLPRLVLHVTKVLVVTTPGDVRTHALAAEYPDQVEIYKTDAFYRNGASFNKGLAMEEGFDFLGRDGWILILDSDIVLPAVLPPLTLTVGKLYTPSRRILSNAAIDGLKDVNTIDVEQLPVRQESGNFGYFQLFNAADPVIQQQPWYGIDWVHAGGCDSVFQKRWAKQNRLRMPFHVVHLGDPDNNWFGRSTPRVDTKEVDPQAAERLAMQNALHRKYGWKGHKKTGEAVVERLVGDPNHSEECHNHDEHKVQVKQRKGPPAKVPTVPATPPAQPPKVPPLRQVPSANRLRGLKN